MSFPAPASLLRHRPPALLIDGIMTHEAGAMVCVHRGVDALHWCQLLDGAAQAAGLLRGLDVLQGSARRVVAAYDDVVIHATSARGPVRFAACYRKTILEMHQFDVSVTTLDGQHLLDARITLAVAP